MSDRFLYQINFNRRKFPEICEALDEAKRDNGVAWYIRKLIERDIKERNMQVAAYQEKIEVPEVSRVTVSSTLGVTESQVVEEDDLDGFA